MTHAQKHQRRNQGSGGRGQGSGAHDSNPGPRRAFTLVEILIVIVIVAILAAVVLPRFTDATQEASSSSLRAQLKTIRSQVELYRQRHYVVPPLGTSGTVSDWDPLVNPVGEPPYMQAAPYNPYTDSYGIGVEPSVSVGWIWDAGTGRVTAPYFDEGTGLYSPP